MDLPFTANTLRQVFIQSLCFLPVVLVAVLLLWKTRVLSAKSKVPFREMRRRPAGESLRLKIEGFDDKIRDWVMYLAGFPAVIGLAGGLIRVPGVVFPTVLLLICAIAASVCGWKLYNLLRTRANHQLGFDGERFVGEELTRLVADGFEIYHDVQFDQFNIDHVLVGASGVFAVETKTRRKPVTASGEKEYQVEFDGFRLHWPMGSDAHGLEQAANNARTLSQWLTGAVGETVSVTPILTLPGWMVNRKAPSKAVHVVNPKEIAKVCNSKRETLNETLIRRICYQLEQKCKLGVE